MRGDFTWNDNLDRLVDNNVETMPTTVESVEKAWLDGYMAAIGDLERLLPGRIAAVMTDLRGDLTELKKAGQRRQMRKKLAAS